MIDAPKTKDEARAFRYGETAGNPRGFAYNRHRCAYELWPASAWSPRQCKRHRGYGPEALYCKAHAKKVQG